MIIFNSGKMNSRIFMFIIHVHVYQLQGITYVMGQFRSIRS